MNINRVRSAPIAVYEDVQMALHLDTEVLKAWRVVKTRAVKTIEGVESAGEDVGVESAGRVWHCNY